MKVSVIGAGVIGVAIAEELASRGAKVRVFDSRRPGDGATQASAGMLAPYIEGHGATLLSLCVASFDQYGEFVARVQRRGGVSVEYKCDGALQVARDDAGRAELEETCRRLVVAGVAHERLDGPELRSFEPRVSPTLSAGVLVRPHGYVNVGELMSALVASASRNGVEFTCATVEAVETGEHLARVMTSAGPADADAVVVAAGSWSGRLRTGDPVIPVRPVRGQLVHLRFDEAPISRIVFEPDCYLVPRRDGSVLVGATVEEAGFDEQPTTTGVSGLLAAGRQLVPELANGAVHAVRVGLRPATVDELPVIGRSPTMPRVFHATGHYRNGVLLAPLTAVLVADLVIDDRQGEALAGTQLERFD